ncbi:MAG: 30S ribosomal protein S20 [Candidatus Omnitrophica bacterium]|nr:30S ribosomal protein S20 [Candidatus Omnitrophota bacterium]
MPNIPSAAKRMRADAKKRQTNQASLSELKTLTRKLYKLAAEKDLKKTAELAQRVVKKYDQAASNGIIPRSRADRKKARVAQVLRKIKSNG